MTLSLIFISVLAVTILLTLISEKDTSLKKKINFVASVMLVVVLENFMESYFKIPFLLSFILTICVLTMLELLPKFIK